MGVFRGFNTFTLPLWLASFTSSYLLLSALGNTRSLEGALISPIVGVWSDRTWIRWLGRRRPFILAGGTAAAILVGTTPFVSAWPIPPLPSWLPDDVRRLAPAIAVIFLFTLAFSALEDVYRALLADLTTGAQRNQLSAWRVIVEMVGSIVLIVVVGTVWHSVVAPEAFLVAGAMILAGVLVTVVGLREYPRWSDAAAAKPERQGSDLVSRTSLIRPATTCFFLAAFAYFVGVDAVLPLLSVYVRDVLGTSAGDAQLLPGLLLVSTTLFALPMGYLGTRFGKRRIVSLGLATVAAAAIGGIFMTTRQHAAAVFLVAGVGNAALTVLAVPLLADLVPRERMGAASGLMAVSASLAAPFATVVAGGLADVYGPRTIFLVMAVMVLAALALMAGVRVSSSEAASHPASPPERLPGLLS
jgi:Na+/melibiose symporter-like transporter